MPKYDVKDYEFGTEPVVGPGLVFIKRWKIKSSPLCESGNDKHLMKKKA